MHRLSTLFALLAAVPVVAQQDTLRLTVDLGFVNTAGNTEVTSLNVGQRVRYRTDGLTLTQRFSVVYGRTSGVTTASQWKAGLRADYRILGPVSAFTLGAYERNTFAGIERRFEEAAGLAATLLAGDGNTLETELGASLNQQTPVTGTTETFAAGRVAAAYRRDLTATAFLTVDGEFLPNFKTSDDWRVNGEATLVAPISSRIATKLSYVVRYDNLPETGFDTTDRIFTAGLQLTF